MNDESSLSGIVVVLLALAVLVPLLGMLVTMPMVGMWGGSHVGDGGGGMWGGAGVPWLWPLLWLVVIGLVATGGYLLYRATGQSGDEQADPALEELRVAYARGELTDEQFEKRRQRLQREE